jgi:hypothetical protein
MSKSSILLRAAVAALGLAAIDAAAAQSYPRIVGSGENASIEYGPGAAYNVVGGGSARVTGSGESLTVEHADPGYAQQTPAGLIAVTVGTGDNASSVLVPVQPPAVRAARAQTLRSGG